MNVSSLPLILSCIASLPYGQLVMQKKRLRQRRLQRNYPEPMLGAAHYAHSGA